MERDVGVPATENRARRPGGDEDDFDDYDYGAHRHAYIDELPPALTHPHDVDRGENLRKIHAQSSAETSGLGDSLQRIHAHSSTETSGYADTIPSPTAAAYSPTGADTSSISGMAGRQQRVRRQLTDSVTETVRHTDTGPFPEPGPLQKKRSGRPAVASRARSIDSAAAGADGRERGNGGADGSAPSHAMSTRKKRLEKDSAGTARYEALQSPDDAAPQPMFETPPTSRKWTRPDFLAEFAPPLSRENSAGSSLAGSVGSAGSNLFLGRSTQSTWLQWSHARRASFKQKIVSIDERQKEEEKNRVTTPVLKARKESLMFVSTDTQRKGSPPPADTRLMVCSELPAEITSRTMARRKLATNDKDEVKLTVMQWRALVAFWEHPLFVRSRGGGIVLSLVAFACGVFSIVTHDWSLFDGHPCYGRSQSGLWVICSSNPSNCSSILDRGFNLGLWQDSYRNASAERRWDTCQEAKSYWQWGVVATIAFSMSFALLAIMLSFSGLLAATLSSKIYYYHSAGEIYIICAASFATSLVLYPFVTELERNLSTSHVYGHGYLAGWIGTLLFLASSFFLCLDDIFRLTVRGLGYCNPDGTQNARI